ncbi:Yorkie-like protein [Euroglyphus maynei]|uniref:Yorkie-like protein n=1 Tax=Euroglyphus maynei TaxID=6958 RepID=A0A1Y3BEU9_EURMA|nr:Yorkie-like protein [Euroglyphus maynei]
MHLKPDSETTNHTNNNNNSNNNANGNAIVRVETAADEGLDELFKAVMSPNDGQSRLPQQVPMRQRRLPPSFFRPPSAASSINSLASASHSRESSLDGGYQSQGQTPIASNGQNKINNSPLIGYSAANGLAIIHPRANSSPAALPPASLNTGSTSGNASLNGGQGTFGSNDIKSPNDSATNQISHYRQMSYDLDQIRLPDGWEMSYTASGERYFLNHKEKTTTWEDPRKKIVEEMLRRSTPPPPHQPSQQPQQPIIQPSTPTAVPLQASTTPAVVEPEQLSYIDPSIVPLPDGWEQAQTSSGDIYFISHVDQTTTWFHPSIPRNLQMKRIQQQTCSIQPPPFQNSTNIPPELVVALKNMNTSGQAQAPPVAVTATATSTTQNQHLRDLELERERMKQRQEELLQSSLLSSTASNIMLSSSSETAASPFLPLPNGCHSRQESFDSGLDLGNSSNFSMPHTPDNFLRLSNNAAQQSSSMAAAVVAPTNTPATISDDLAFENMQISGLDLDSESMDFMQGLDMDLLSNVEELLNSNKDNIMTWL